MQKNRLFIRRLRISQRLTLLGAIAFVVIAALSYVHVNDILRRHELQAQKHVGIHQLRPIYPLYSNLLEIRDTVNLYLHTKAVSKRDNSLLRERIGQLERQLQQALQWEPHREHDHNHSIHLLEDDRLSIRLASIIGAWQTIDSDKINSSEHAVTTQSVAGLSGMEQYRVELEQLIINFSERLVNIAESSRLIEESSLDLLYLVELIVDDLPSAANAASIARSTATTGLVKKQMTLKERSNLGFYYGELRSRIDKVNVSLKKAYMNFPGLEQRLKPFQHNINQRLGQVSDSIEAMVQVEKMDSPVFELLGAQTLFSEGRKGLKSIFELNEAILLEIEYSLEGQEAAIKRQMFFTISLILVALTLLAWGGTKLIRSITQPVGELIKAMREISTSDDYSKRIQVLCKDEIGSLGDTFNEMAEGIEQRNHALSQSKAELERASRAKDEFIASMSHELRTPLTVIIGNSEILSEQITSEAQRSLVQDIDVAGRSQLALVNDILDMSKIESGKFTIDNSPYNLESLLQQLQSMLSVKAQDAGLELRVELKSKLNYKLIGDAQRINQILINLIGNAIKFTQKGAVDVTCWLSAEVLHCEVKDSGIGMSPQILERLFKRFEQADGSISRRFGGSGLGLFISKNLAELMGGDIRVHSVEGVGSTFTLELPYQQSETPSTLHTERYAALDPLSTAFQAAVLLAEDTPLLQRLEQRTLEELGLEVSLATNGEEAVALANSQAFDLILMDMQMPVMDGIQATQALRDSGNSVPIVALTANVMERHRDQFFGAGCDAFLGKPIDRNELLETIAPYLQEASEHRVAQPVAEAAAEEGGESRSHHALAPIIWSERFSVGHPIMDQQHQVLIGYINQLISHSGHATLKKSREMMLEILPDLNRYAAEHFHAEEQLLKESNYSELEQQISDHERYGRKVASFYEDELNREKISQLLQFLVSWWSNHILFEDMAYRALFEEPISETLMDDLPTSEELISSFAEDDEMMALCRETFTQYREELIEHLPNEAWSSVQSVAHVIKGSGSMFGFDRLSEQGQLICELFEQGEKEKLSAETRLLIRELDHALETL